jgi:hypothetical protein
MLAALALFGVAALTNSENLMGLAIVIAASGFLGYGVIDAYRHRRARRSWAGTPEAQVNLRLCPKTATTRTGPTCGLTAHVPGHRAGCCHCRVPRNNWRTARFAYPF